MDANRFDQLSRLFATINTRRSLSRLLLGAALLAGVRGPFGAEPAVTASPQEHRSAQKRRRRKKRPKRKPQPTSQTPTTQPCPACQVRDGAAQYVADPSKNRTDCAGSAGATSVCCNGSCCPGCCDGAGACGACRVFVTSTDYRGDRLGGLTGGDAKCRDRAIAGGLPGADIVGNYKAWLSDSTVSPSSRFRCTQASCSSQGYRLLNETKVADDWSDLTSCAGPCLDHAIDVTELNGAVGSANVWTHTLTDGTPGGFANEHCLNWSTDGEGQVGDDGGATQGDAGWTQLGALPCTSPNRLYCFQQR